MNMQDRRPIVVGSGIAGLSAALALYKAGAAPLVVTAGKLGFGSSEEARGGMAAALAKTDSAAAHATDTLAVGGGLCLTEMVHLITAEGAKAVHDLHALGVAFDEDFAFDEDNTTSHRFSLGREAGHQAHRIVHAKGDATGKEIMRALSEAVREAVQKEKIELFENVAVTQLLRDEEGVFGVCVVDSAGSKKHLHGSDVVLATGGLGGLYHKTTNPGRNCGIGLALAARAGAALADLEFVQFHPTALDVTQEKDDDTPLPLLSEALRGAGATLVDPTGKRFMLEEHEAAELAPRDVVARAVSRTIIEKGAVYLDARHLDVEREFPAAWQSAHDAGFDSSKDLLPVVPAHHFHMGGVATDKHGATNVLGLWAVGEVAHTGLHGANRLASNSLLEGWVMGQRCAAAVVKIGFSRRERSQRLGRPITSLAPTKTLHQVPIEQHSNPLAAIQALMEEHMGVLRNGFSLAFALKELQKINVHLAGEQEQTAHLVATLMCRAALARSESRGAHFREDFAPLATLGNVKSVAAVSQKSRVA
ncbi:MAG: FAD-binding protein [Deltaproteobacteria bacterium]|nr:FAD-binding protein [Deltaproteobacteria bacterium]